MHASLIGHHIPCSKRLISPGCRTFLSDCKTVTAPSHSVVGTFKYILKLDTHTTTLRNTILLYHLVFTREEDHSMTNNLLSLLSLTSSADSINIIINSVALSTHLHYYSHARYCTVHIDLYVYIYSFSLFLSLSCFYNSCALFCCFKFISTVFLPDSVFIALSI